MTPEQREELKQAAMKATLGKWNSDETRVYYPNMAGGFCLRQSPNPEANAKYIAAASPAVVLSLIAQVEALTVPQWIKTDDRLPELDVPVLAIRNGCLGIGGRYASANGGIGYRFNNTTSSGDLMKFECWMHVPTIPAIPGTKEDA